MDEIGDFVLARYPHAGWIHEYLIMTISTFVASGCQDKEYLIELMKGDDYFYSRAWEAVLYQTLIEQGFRISGPDGGPDFLLDTANAGPVFVEATTPKPEGLPAAWLDEKGDVHHMPHEEMLLRWTNSLSTKSRKHIEDITKGNAEHGVSFVIAINSCRLSRSPMDEGISGKPFAVEAVFPIGPVAVKVNRDTGEFGDAYQSWRDTIPKPKTSKDIPTDNFLNDDYSHVSALIGCSRLWNEKDREPQLPTRFLVHNPLAKNPLPHGWLAGAVEYVADIKDDEISISRIA